MVSESSDPLVESVIADVRRHVGESVKQIEHGDFMASADMIAFSEDKVRLHVQLALAKARLKAAQDIASGITSYVIIASQSKIVAALEARLQEASV